MTRIIHGPRLGDHICDDVSLHLLTTMTFEPTANLLAFVLPMSFKTGELTFTTTSMDKQVRMLIKPGDRPRNVVSTADLTKGMWRAILRWSDGRSQYQDEKEIVIV